jgi:uridylate kinase
LHRIVIKLSGSVFKAPLNIDLIKELCETFSSLMRDGIQPIIVAGGGEIARIYINAVRALNSGEAILDEMGIGASRLNARVIIAGLGNNAYPVVPTSTDEISLALASGKAVVLGGLYPGHSTNATAALVAEISKADLFLNATNVDGVYSEDPKTSKNARKFDSIDTQTLLRLIRRSPIRAGSYELMDPLSIMIIERSKIKTRVILCSPQSIREAVKGVPVGTEIFVVK